MKSTITTIALLILPILIYANSSIDGQVKTESGEALSFATVALMNSADSSLIKGQITDVMGAFSLPDVGPGEYYIAVSMVGFDPINYPITIQEGQKPGPISIVLSESTLALQEVVVTAEKPLFEQRIDRTVVNVSESATNAGSNAMDVLTKSPGVDVDQVNNTVSLAGRQGVVVMLNGKRTRMDGAALLQYLQGISSDNIEKIELFTTPPANFDAEGNAGMINIVTKKNLNNGLNGNASVNLGYGANSKYGGSLSLNYSKNKIHLFGDLSSTNDNAYHEVRAISSSSIPGREAANDLLSERPAYVGMQRGSLGMSYDLSNKTTVGAGIGGHLSDWDMNATSYSDFYSPGTGAAQYVQESHEINYWEHYNFNLNITHQFNENTKISGDYDYLNYLDDNPTDYKEESFDDGQLIEQRSYNSEKLTPIVFHVGKVDFSYQVNDRLSLETGIKETFSDFDNSVIFNDIIDGEEVRNEELSDRFKMTEQINAAYISSNYQLNKSILIKGGLRYEQNITKLTSNKDGLLVDRNRKRLFPTLFVNYQLDENSSIGFSYAKRLTRPSLTFLAPAYYFFDRNTIFTGNISLQSVITTQWNVDYSFKDLTVSAKFSDEENPFSWGQSTYNEDGILIYNASHLLDRKIGSLNLNYSVSPTDFWKSSINVSGFWKQEVTGAENGALKLTRSYLQANMSQNFTLPKGFNLELSGNVNSRIQYGINYLPSRVTFNLGLQKSFKNNSKLSLNVSDLFNLGSFWRVISEEAVQEFSMDFHYDIEGNVVRLSYSIPFGNDSVKKNRRSTASSEERSRVN